MGLVLVGGLSALTTGVPPSTVAGSSNVASAALPPTHGDLVVLSGETFTIRPTPGTHTYYQGGNITVDAGGTLNVLNVTLSFVQFVSDTGNAMQRLSHIYRFIDHGTVNLRNSTVTTDVQQILNAYAKLNVTVAGNMTAWNSTFAFPGWITVTGAFGDLTLNDSKVTANPNVLSLSEPSTILGDTRYAPSITVSAGAKLNAFDSAFNDTYADDTSANGQPAPVPLALATNPGLVPISPGVYNFSDLVTPTDSANLTRDYLYPSANFTQGYLVMNWTNPNPTIPGVVEAFVWYNGHRYTVSTDLVFTNNSLGNFYTSLPANLLQNITRDGVLNYLNWTGDFGVTPSRIAIEFEELSGPAILNVSASLSLLPSPQYDVVVTGVGSTLNSVDTVFDLNWNPLPANATSQTIPFPWNSNKLLLIHDATAYLANATISNPIPGVFSHSAVLPDSSSQAFFYRWAEFNLTGRGGSIPIPDAQVVAFYATQNQADNQTASALNDLAVSNPEIWGYAQYWDHVHGVRAYGESNIMGVASVLLASSNVTSSTLPDGFFLGTYHFGVVVHAPGVGSHWFNWSVSPYPQGVAQTAPAVAGPDVGPAQNFPGYFGGVTIASTTVLVNGQPSTNLNLGQQLAIRVQVEDIGTAPVNTVNSSMFYGITQVGTTYSNESANLTAPGQTLTITLTWTATEVVTGPYIFPFVGTLVVNLVWNNDSAVLGGGGLSEPVYVTFEPTLLAIGSVTVTANGVTNSTIELGQTMGVQVVLTDVGNSTIQALTVWLYYNKTVLLSPAFTTPDAGLTAAGQSLTLNFTWNATENITGLHGWWFYHNLRLTLTYNNVTSDLWLGNGTLARNVSVIFNPSEIRIVSLTAPPTSLDPTIPYSSNGVLTYNGSYKVGSVQALIELFATPVAGGMPILIGSTSSGPGSFVILWGPLNQLVTPLTPGTAYILSATASYNSREANITLPGTYSIPLTPSPTTNFFLQKFLGIPLWAWIAIAAAIVVGLLVFLFVIRRRAAGKLVECGECGNLIPEEATVCPKCGAEFESDLVRCSRCASTIPADSKFCPECAAQLLGAPGEAASDPEKQAYADFTEKYRAEAKRELGDNYSEGAFWDWWKRQPSYTPFSQWSVQQGQGMARAGMTAPPAGTETTSEAPTSAGTPPPPKGGAGWVEGTGAGAAAAPAAAPPAAAPTGAGLKACPNCGKEIPSEYLVCPFCNAVTQ